MKLKATQQHFKPYIGMVLLYALSLVLKGQSSGEGSMTQFYIVAIVFAVIILAAILSFFISQKKKRND
jgi:multisubunit Na+/H+ antiporter MnhB subunit